MAYSTADATHELTLLIEARCKHEGIKEADVRREIQSIVDDSFITVKLWIHYEEHDDSVNLPG